MGLGPGRCTVAEGLGPVALGPGRYIGLLALGPGVLGRAGHIVAGVVVV